MKRAKPARDSNIDHEPTIASFPCCFLDDDHIDAPASNQLHPTKMDDACMIFWVASTAPNFESIWDRLGLTCFPLRGLWLVVGWLPLVGLWLVGRFGSVGWLVLASSFGSVAGSCLVGRSLFRLDVGNSLLVVYLFAFARLHRISSHV